MILVDLLLWAYPCLKISSLSLAMLLLTALDPYSPKEDWVGSPRPQTCVGEMLFLQTMMIYPEERNLAKSMQLQLSPQFQKPSTLAWKQARGIHGGPQSSFSAIITVLWISAVYWQRKLTVCALLVQTVCAIYVYSVLFVEICFCCTLVDVNQCTKNSIVTRMTSNRQQVTSDTIIYDIDWPLTKIDTDQSWYKECILALLVSKKMAELNNYEWTPRLDGKVIAGVERENAIYLKEAQDAWLEEWTQLQKWLEEWTQLQKCWQS